MKTGKSITPTKLLSSRDILSIVNMEEAINVIEKAFHDFSAQRYVMPVRTVTDFGENELSLFYKPCYLPSEDIVCVKLISQLKKSHPDDIPTIRGLIILTDPVTNSAKAIMDGASLTAIRTGAASGVATKHLARENSAVLALFGAGTQAYTQLEAVCSVRTIEETFIYDINRDAAERFARHFKDKSGSKISVADDLSSLPMADIICTVTPSAKPLFSVESLKPGVHINAVGSYNPRMQELPNDLFTRAFLYVDHKESCFSESGDLINPMKQGTLNMDNYRGEIG
ncbi:MAG: ornithine cyclodeaminase, partial [Bacteroidales bacterium]|nr:ornithine cyclodeaminase [Bacteroidales bacterium]